jgi:hypothetical protein
VTTHHSVLAARIIENKFPWPSDRHITVSIGRLRDDSAKSFLRCDVMEKVFDEVSVAHQAQKDLLRQHVLFFRNLNHALVRLPWTALSMKH